ncbi:MAG: gas vesicle protein GvpD basic region 2 domain-containing protein, partial [Candidatus Ranarchaeia archaeon]
KNDVAKYSTGILDLDSILNSGYPFGSTVLLEVGSNIPTNAVSEILFTQIANFLKQENGVIMTPTGRMDYKQLKVGALKFGFTDQLNSNLRLMTASLNPQEREQYFVPLKEDHKPTEILEDCYREISSKSERQLRIIGLDFLQQWMNSKELKQYIRRVQTEVQVKGNLLLCTGYSGTKELNEIVESFAVAHIQLNKVLGNVLLTFLKHRRPPYNLQIDKEGLSLREVV